MKIHQVTSEEYDPVITLAGELWPEHDADALRRTMLFFLNESNCRFFLAEREGFAFCRIKEDYFDGPGLEPYGYLEGIYVRKDFRRRGIATALLAACEEWAVEQGCRRFGSDARTSNRQSICFHREAGFSVRSRLVLFRKSLPEGI